MASTIQLTAFGIYNYL